MVQMENGEVVRGIATPLPRDWAQSAVAAEHAAALLAAANAPPGGWKHPIPGVARPGNTRPGPPPPSVGLRFGADNMAVHRRAGCPRRALAPRARFATVWRRVARCCKGMPCTDKVQGHRKELPA